MRISDWSSDVCSSDLRFRRRRDSALPHPVLVGARRRGARGGRPDRGAVRRMNLASPFSIAIVAITALAVLGLPIGHAMIAGSILYLLLAGLDMGADRKSTRLNSSH